jgi:hypothetical protein
MICPQANSKKRNRNSAELESWVVPTCSSYPHTVLRSKALDLWESSLHDLVLFSNHNHILRDKIMNLSQNSLIHMFALWLLPVKKELMFVL